MENERLFKQYREGNHWKNHPTSYAEKFVNFLKKKEIKGLIVDGGFGSGRDINVFNSAGFNSMGVDYSKEEVQISRKNYPNLKFEIQNVESLRFKDKSISAIFCINLIHYVKKEKTLKEFFRVLKKGGYLFIHFNIEIKDKEGNINYEHKEEDILSLISNFEIIEKENITRIDNTPKKHTHKIMELILQKQ